MAPRNTPIARTPQTRPTGAGRRGSKQGIDSSLTSAGKAYDNTGTPNRRPRTMGHDSSPGGTRRPR